MKKSRFLPLRVLGAAAVLAAALGPAACKKKEAALPPPPTAFKEPPPKAAPAPAAAAGVAVSTAPAAPPAPPRPPSPDDYYKAAKMRDPFMNPSAGGALQAAAVPAAAAAGTAEEKGAAEPADAPVEPPFDIHNLDLKGVLNDSRGQMALLVDKTTRMSYVLKGGKVLGSKNEPVPNVSGKIMGQAVRLITSPDHDVQELRLGEAEPEE